MTNCPNCGGPTIPLFTGTACKNECDLRATVIEFRGEGPAGYESFDRLPKRAIPVKPNAFTLAGTQMLAELAGLSYVLEVRDGRWTGWYWYLTRLCGWIPMHTSWYTRHVPTPGEEE